MSVPADSDAITPEWLTAALRKAEAISHARVTSIQSGPVGHMGMTGQLAISANADPHVQPDNLLVAGDGEPSLALVDWQLQPTDRSSIWPTSLSPTWIQLSGVNRRIGY